MAEDGSLEHRPAAAAPGSEISFRNGLTVRVSLLAASLVEVVIMGLTSIGGALLMPVVVLAGGAYAVFLYKRRSEVTPDSISGARLGWITGVFVFLISTVLFTIGMAALAGNREVAEAFKQGAASMGMTADSAQKVEDMLKNPTTFAVSLALGLLLQFFVYTIFGSLGGALGARFFKKPS
jgi:hypothetical protein